jgi:phage repressor protein C with HTH and peptisase S24 domain
MEPQIPEGSYCIFKAPVVGTRNGKIVLVQHHDVFDPDHGGAYSIKKYSSEKQFDKDGNWQHEKIVLHPINPSYKPIEILEPESESFIVIAGFIGIIPAK